MFSRNYDLEACENEKRNPSWRLASSQICLLIYGASSRSLFVFDTLQPLPEEDERLVCDNFMFIVATPELGDVALKRRLRLLWTLLSGSSLGMK